MRIYKSEFNYDVIADFSDEKIRNAIKNHPHPFAVRYFERLKSELAKREDECKNRSAMV